MDLLGISWGSHRDLIGISYGSLRDLMGIPQKIFIKREGVLGGTVGSPKKIDLFFFVYHILSYLQQT